jgi:hypothetical protein
MTKAIGTPSSRPRPPIAVFGGTLKAEENYRRVEMMPIRTATPANGLPPSCGRFCGRVSSGYPHQGGKITDAVDFDSDDDEAAKKHARDAANGGVQLWQRQRKAETYRMQG